jgi:hypothetical protein
MGVRVTVIKTGQPLSQLKMSSRELMKDVGLLARERVIRRTLSGRDENDASFQPYSALYALRKAQETGSSSVNLQLSGAMLNAIVITELTDTSVTLGFSS